MRVGFIIVGLALKWISILWHTRRGWALPEKAPWRQSDVPVPQVEWGRAGSYLEETRNVLL